MSWVEFVGLMGTLVPCFFWLRRVGVEYWKNRFDRRINKYERELEWFEQHAESTHQLLLFVSLEFAHFLHAVLFLGLLGLEHFILTSLPGGYSVWLKVLIAVLGIPALFVAVNVITDVLNRLERLKNKEASIAKLKHLIELEKVRRKFTAKHQQG